ncbi:MAG: hybrid sensor histidine kinase/response regulator, partial [Odoribacter splanchnicus]
IANLSVPVFALKSAVMNNSGMVGGYIYDEQAFLAHLQQTILSVLADTPPRKIPFYVPTEAKPTFSYPSMLLKGFSVEDFPQNSVFIDRPQTFFEQHKFSIILGASLIAVLLIAVFAYLYYRLHILNVLNEAQRRQFETTRELTNLFDNMPVAYMKAKLLYNADGEIADMEIGQTNERFTINFARGLESDSYRGSELFGADLGPSLRLAKLAETEKRAITYTQYFSAPDLYQNIVITPPHSRVM